MQVIYLAFDVLLGSMACGKSREYVSADNSAVARRDGEAVGRPATDGRTQRSIPDGARLKAVSAWIERVIHVRRVVSVAPRPAAVIPTTLIN